MAGRLRARAHHSSLERLFGQLRRWTWAVRWWEGDSTWSRWRLGRGRPQPQPVFPEPRYEELQEETKGGGMWLEREPGAVTVPALDPTLGAVPGPMALHTMGEGRAWSLEGQPPREDQWRASEGNQDPSPKPVWP